MTIINQFSSGLESANFVVTSDHVHKAWAAIEKQNQTNPNAESCLYSEFQSENLTIIAFGATPFGTLEGQEALVSSAILKGNSFATFDFLLNKSNPVFSINQAVINIFQSHYNELDLLRSKLVDNSKTKPASLVIITGQFTGGCVATLFTLWLLAGLNPAKTKRPLCITFGSPLIGDEQLRQCVLKFSTWKSCFLHIVSNQDPAPTVFLPRNASVAYQPFGTFLLCSSSGCACSEDPDFILEHMGTTNAHNQDPNVGCHYGQILEDLKCKALCNPFKFTGGERDALQASLMTQLHAIGVLSKQPAAEIRNLIGRMKKHETKLKIQREKNSDSDKKLNEMKVCMACLEWYKKESKRNKIGYYDMYKNHSNISDVKVNEYKKRLMNYWEDSVTEVENKPQLEGAHFKVRWLYAGANYTRMVEPLHIADFYKDGGENYIAGGKRPKHFILLEDWLKKEEKPGGTPMKSKRESVGSTLNEDSCFWARVEEALILCNLLNSGKPLSAEEKECALQELRQFESLVYDALKKPLSAEEKECALQELRQFESLVYDALKNYALSPEIFLEKSSFMQWWKEYKTVIENPEQHPYSSLLVDFMKDRRSHTEYEAGRWEFT